jgi:hypothetical protein
MARRLWSLGIVCILSMAALAKCSSGASEISLWNGKDFTGWGFALANDSTAVEDVWSIGDGVIRCAGVPNGYMYTTSDHANYILTVEWRWPEKAGNSGVLLHAQEPFEVWPRCIECQLQSGNAGNFVLMGQASLTARGEQYNNTARFMGIKRIAESSEKPIGEWNTYRIICRDDSITCYVNDVLQNQGTQASFRSGRICLQSEGAPVEFRNVRLEPLD